MLYVPSFGLVNLTGLGGNLTAGSTGAFSQKAGGVVYDSLVDNSSASASAPASIQPTTAATCFWMGQSSGVPNGNAVFIGVEHNNANTDPYFGVSMYGDATSALLIGWNISGVFAAVSSAAALNSTNLITSYAGVVDLIGNTATLAKNGSVLMTTAAGGTGTFNYGATSVIDLAGFIPVPTRRITGSTLVGAIYNRALSDSELAWLHADPYAMLIPEG